MTTHTLVPTQQAPPGEFEHQGVTLRPIPRFDDYWAGDDGHIWSTKKGTPKRLKETTNRKLRMQTVSLYRHDRRYDRTLKSGAVRSCMMADVRYVHLLVASVWLPPKPSPLHQIDHRWEDRRDNRPESLRWVTTQENNQAFHANHPNHFRGKYRGSMNGFAKLNEQKVREILQLRGTVTQRVAASMFGIVASTVGGIWTGQTWKHVQLGGTTNE